MNKKFSNQKKIKNKFSNQKKIKNKVSNQWKIIFVTATVFAILIASLFIFTSRKSDYQKALEAETGSSSNESTIDTNTDTGTNTTNQTAASEKETAAETSVSGTETTAATETTAVPTNPAAQQIIEVTARSGGYSPRKIEAKADVPTILIMKSEGAYGCERAFYIPDLNIGEILPENGQTQFDLGVQPKGTKLLGVCGMGMYYFQIFFN
jgi:hypothetical protein